MIADGLNGCNVRNILKTPTVITMEGVKMGARQALSVDPIVSVHKNPHGAIRQAVEYMIEYHPDWDIEYVVKVKSMPGRLHDGKPCVTCWVTLDLSKYVGSSYKPEADSVLSIDGYDMIRVVDKAMRHMDTYESRRPDTSSNPS